MGKDFYTPSREEMVDMLWSEAKAETSTPKDKAVLCRTISKLMGYNRPDDYSDLEEQLRAIEARATEEPERPWWDQAGPEQ